MIITYQNHSHYTKHMTMSFQITHCFDHERLKTPGWNLDCPPGPGLGIPLSTLRSSKVASWEIHWKLGIQ